MQADIYLRSAAHKEAYTFEERSIYEPVEYEEFSKKIRKFGCENVILTDRGTFLDITNS